MSNGANGLTPNLISLAIVLVVIVRFLFRRAIDRLAPEATITRAL
jgi:hypothetical protein